MALQVNPDISGLHWITISGTHEEVFRDLGRHMAKEIYSVIETMPEREPLERWSRTEQGERTVARLLATAQSRYPEELLELEALADGSGVPFDELFLANIRGDIGSYDGTGCTDILWKGDHAYSAHNEDGAPAVGRDLTLLTIRIDGEPSIFTECYPGFLPCNAFTLTESGLAWGINHLPVASPANAAGRHFVSRALQRCETIDEAAAFLKTHPMAGGFSFNFASAGERREINVECAAGKYAIVENERYSWHANHLLHMGGAPLDAIGESAVARALGPMDESLRRGALLEDAAPAGQVDAQWIWTMLTGAELPDGVYRTARGDDPLETLCTTVFDLDACRLHIKGHGSSIESFDMAQLQLV